MNKTLRNDNSNKLNNENIDSALTLNKYLSHIFQNNIVRVIIPWYIFNNKVYYTNNKHVC